VSDLMLLGVLEMPAEMIMGSPISVMQYIGRGHEAAERIRSDGVRIAELESQLAARTSPTADDAKPVGEAFYDGASNEPVLMWVYDGYKPAPNHVVLIAATAQPAKDAVADTSADYDVESLMDRWDIPSHLRDRFRSPMRKLVACKKQDAAAIASAEREGK
jgi:hypothetical protein